MKEFSKVQENGLSEKRPSRSSQRRPSQTVLKIDCFKFSKISQGSNRVRFFQLKLPTECTEKLPDANATPQQVFPWNSSESFEDSLISWTVEINVH